MDVVSVVKIAVPLAKGSAAIKLCCVRNSVTTIAVGHTPRKASKHATTVNGDNNIAGLVVRKYPWFYIV